VDSSAHPQKQLFSELAVEIGVVAEPSRDGKCIVASSRGAFRTAV
jgi:hypothetical protein